MFDPKADLFFENPQVFRQPPRDYGVLYLLRRDVNSCLGGNPPLAIWPGGMAILAGIDLVAKFYKGDDTIGEVSLRFKCFVENYFQPLSPDDKETIYQLRNSLLHSFGLYSQNKTKKYHFLLTAAGCKPFIQQPSANVYQVDIIGLHQRFEQALILYMKELENQPPLQSNFLKMFTNYGAIHIG